jgi:hypothetical protein
LLGQRHRHDAIQFTGDHQRQKNMPEEEASIRVLAPRTSMRSPAPDFGLSHETIRLVIRTQTARKPHVLRKT